MTTLGTHVVLSTAHLTESVSAALSKMGADTEDRPDFTDWRQHVVHTPHAYGHWVRVTATIDETERAQAISELPACLAACVRHADAWGARWIMFDRDEPPTSGIEEHDW